MPEAEVEKRECERNARERRLTIILKLQLKALTVRNYVQRQPLNLPIKILIVQTSKLNNLINENFKFTKRKEAFLCERMKVKKTKTERKKKINFYSTFKISTLEFILKLFYPEKSLKLQKKNLGQGLRIKRSGINKKKKEENFQEFGV